MRSPEERIARLEEKDIIRDGDNLLTRTTAVEVALAALQAKVERLPYIEKLIWGLYALIITSLLGTIAFLTQFDLSMIHK